MPMAPMATIAQTSELAVVSQVFTTERSLLAQERGLKPRNGRRDGSLEWSLLAQERGLKPRISAATATRSSSLLAQERGLKLRHLPLVLAGIASLLAQERGLKPLREGRMMLDYLSRSSRRSVD